MKPTLETKLERKLFGQRQAILQTNYRETVAAVDAVFQLVAAGYRHELAKARLNADGGFPTRRRGGKTVAGKVGDGHDRRRRQSLGEKYLCQRAHLIRRAERRLGRIRR